MTPLEAAIAYGIFLVILLGLLHFGLKEILDYEPDDDDGEDW